VSNSLLVNITPLSVIALQRGADYSAWVNWLSLVMCLRRFSRAGDVVPIKIEHGDLVAASQVGQDGIKL
jgi:hypothetical protein